MTTWNVHKENEIGLFLEFSLETHQCHNNNNNNNNNKNIYNAQIP